MPENFNDYKHFISLGANCFVSEDLKRLGLRDCSYPFDWLFSDDFSGIIAAIENNFSDFLTYDNLLQHENNKNRYYNSIYNFSFYHDFNKFQTLKSQLPFVQEKYSRRINRFMNDIREPTVFFRYIISKGDMNYVVANHRKIETIIKQSCYANRIVYITHYKELLDFPIDVYFIEKDSDDWISRTPLLKNSVLNNILKNTYFKNKEINQSFCKKTNNNISLERIIRKILKKEYVHKNIYKK